MAIKKILVDISTIKENKDAGSTFSYVYTGRESTFDILGDLPEFLKEGENCIICKQTWEDKKILSTIKLLDQSIFKKVTETDNIKNINMQAKYDVVKHLPTPKYSYIYDFIECEECGEKFKYNDLLDSEEEGYEDVCPNCYADNFSNLEFETIDEALKRKKESK